MRLEVCIISIACCFLSFRLSVVIGDSDFGGDFGGGGGGDIGDFGGGGGGGDYGGDGGNY
jgi:hypothetical protein